MDDRYRILWVDDEIELLKSQIIFLEGKNFRVIPAASGEEAAALVKSQHFDLVLLDEMMPGWDGLTTLSEIKRLRPDLPVVMATKSEREDLMEQALGSRIDDFLLKPLNPAQVLASCRKVLEGRRMVQEHSISEYAQGANRLRIIDYPSLDWQGWAAHYLELVEWDLRLAQLPDPSLHQSHESLLREANVEFCRFIENNYPHWLRGGQRPFLSHDVFERFAAPVLQAGGKCLFLLLDCLRLDQWLLIEPLLRDLFAIERHHYYSILPTATPYSRNAIFAGMLPAQIAQHHPQLWEKVNVSNEAGRNRHESQLLEIQLNRLRLKPVPGPRYLKVSNAEESREARRDFGSLNKLPLVALVVNFMDILVHHRAESQLLQEMVPDEKAFRELTHAWFVNSEVMAVLQTAARQGRTVVVTTDHGSIQGRRASSIKAGQDTSANLRYKAGTNISADPRQVLWIKQPSEYQLPEETKGMQYLIAKEDFYMVYPTKFDEYKRRYEGTFQHGGISMEEMILPLAVMRPK
jgi:CheY-like chemotaxis protein